MRKSRFAVLLLAAGLIFSSQARAQFGSGLGSPIEGTYNFSTNGTAFLTGVTAQNNGKCLAANGTVTAGLSGGIISFDGNGGVTGSEVGVSVGATSCTPPNYNITGTYKITNTGDTHFEAQGTLSTSFVGRPAACAGTILNGVDFTLVGSTTDGTFTITTSGGTSSYAEAPPPGPFSCTGSIVNFDTNGSGSKF